ncbi:Uncharacterised protein [Vibrio cholerae]|uniref:Uncharacterized protein n=1 Tax=Vibrio cholerae TaxID=666 RepID=A0A655YC86_VIBCL|nr:Uncharacterised protein [Vibrio cholerae]
MADCEWITRLWTKMCYEKLNISNSLIIFCKSNLSVRRCSVGDSKRVGFLSTKNCKTRHSTKHEIPH